MDRHSPAHFAALCAALFAAMLFVAALPSEAHACAFCPEGEIERAHMIDARFASNFAAALSPFALIGLLSIARRGGANAT